MKNILIRALKDWKINKLYKYFSPKFKQEFLHSPDISICPICGSYEHLWQGLDEDSNVTSYNCTRCGFWAGKYARWWHVFELKRAERKVRRNAI